MTIKSSHRILKPVRLGKAINKAFPTVTDAKFFTHMASYRKDRDQNGTDWEGQRSFFKRVVRFTFKNRHKNV